MAEERDLFSLGNCGEVLAGLHPWRRACRVIGAMSKGRTLTMDGGSECARREVLCLWQYLRRVVDKEEYEVSSWGVVPHVVATLLWAVYLRVGVIGLPLSWPDEGGEASISLGVRTRWVILS